MGKLSRSKPAAKSASQSNGGQTSMLNYFKKVPADQSKLFNQVPPQSKPATRKVSKLSRSANKKPSTGKYGGDISKMLSPEGDKHKNNTGTDNTLRSSNTEEDDDDVTIIPDTPASSALTPSLPSTSLSSLPGSSQSVSLKYNIPETPPSTKSTGRSHTTSKLKPNSLNKQIFSKSATETPVVPSPKCGTGKVLKQSNTDIRPVHKTTGGGSISFKSGAKGCTVSSLNGKTSSGMFKPSVPQGKHSQDSSSNIIRTKSGHSLLADIEMEDDEDDDDYLPIPETQFPDLQLSIPETQFVSEKSHNKQQEKDISECGNSEVNSKSPNSDDARKPSSIFDKVLTSYQKSISEVRGQGSIAGSSIKKRNMFRCKQNEKRKNDEHKAPSLSRAYQGSGSSDRKILTAKRVGNKLSRTYRKLGPGLVTPKSQLSSSLNQEKGVCLDQMDLDLLQDCVTENAVLVPPQKAVLKTSKTKRKSHKITPMRKKDTPGFDDVDCSILEEMLDNLPPQVDGDSDPQPKAETDAFKPTKINLKFPSLSRKENKDKLSLIKTGSKKRSPCRGNSPFAKRVPGNADLVVQPGGTHVKSLFQDVEKHNSDVAYDSVEMMTTSVDDDKEDMNYTNDRIDIVVDDSQPFTTVKDGNATQHEPPPIRRDSGIMDHESVSAILLDKKTPNKLGCSPWKVPPNAAVVESPGGADALWDNLNDSFLLAAADMDVLAEMEADAMCQPTATAGVDSQLSHGLQMMSPFKSQGSSQHHPRVKLPADLNRYVVTSIIQEDWKKTAHLIDLSDHSSKTCILQGTWSETPLHEGLIVAIHGSFDDKDTCTINQQRHFIIVNPDLLLTGTNVTRSIKCLRRSVLGEKFKGLDKGSKPMLLGTMLHDVFDEALAKNNFTADFLRRVVQKTLKKKSFLSEMYSLGLPEKQLLEDAEGYIVTMKHWADRYLQDKPKSTATMEIKFPGEMRAEKCNVSVSGIRDIEETVWSPRWGLKGKVDVTAQIKIHRAQPRNVQKTYTVPLELKTGKQTNSIEHRSQVILYSVMLGDLDSEAANDLGVLLYVKTGEMLAVPSMQMDKRELVHLRNKLAYSLSLPANKVDDGKWIAPSLPDPIQDEFTCTRCSFVTGCAMLTSLNTPTVPMQDFFVDQLSHLSPIHKDYFSHWYLLCALEHMAGEKRNTTKQIWCKDPWEREQKGDCMSGLVVSCSRHHQQRDCFLISFRRKSNHKSTTSLDSLPFSTGDRVVVGLEGTRIVTCCIGFIETISHDHVTITSERSMKPHANGSYRMDKDDGYNSMASSLVNLHRLMEPEQSRLRDLVVGFHKPEFDPESSAIPDSQRNIVDKILHNLNSDQQYAIKRVLCSQQYTLVVGMPGTGKTTTIVGLVRILHACGLSVLLTSYTHSAVDNILLKLCKYGIDFLRLGSKNRIHPDLHKYTEDVLFSKVGSVQQLGSVLETKPVVATTCLGAKSKLLSRRIFDVCIVDEASQIGQLVCLGPLYVANRFVLVGDHQQLPPLVQSHAARQLGMDESLFQRLALHSPQATVQLSLQYRMNSAIMHISNTLVYEGKLQCGNDKIANSLLHIPQWNQIQENIPEKWLQKVLDPATPVIFLNMDKVEKHASDLESKFTVNHTEAALVLKLVTALVQGGCDPSSIGVIAPFRLQCKLLTELLRELHKSSKQSIEVNTVDKYQGRDKEVIIVSFTHSQKGTTDSHSGVLLEDMRRLNVAVTRAKHKLILLGSVTALNKLQTMHKLLDCLASINISDMPTDAITSASS